MKRCHPHLSTILSLCLTMGLLTVPAFAADIADVQLGSDSIHWQPATDAAAWVLTVSGPDGYYVRQEFDSAPSMGLFAADGQFLADGLYKYELQAIPHVGPQLRQELDAAAGNLELRERLAARVQGLGGVQSGHFRIFQGTLVQGDQVELPAPGGGVTVPSGDLAVSQTVPEGSLDQTQVINMDLLVNGSICVGFDCGNSQSFGADTIRLRENNLRIHFDDTSNSASFPSNDWRLKANETTNGGANEFVIEDSTAGRDVFTIEAGAISNALYVDSAGDVGIGTNSPVVEVHAVDGNTPTLRLEQNGSSGFTPQTWDLAGNEANFFVRDVTNGSRLPFRIEPSSPTDSLYVDSTGNIGMGTNTPSEALHVRGTAGDTQVLVEEASGTTDNTRILLQLTNNGAVRYDMTDTNTGNNWSTRNLPGGYTIQLTGDADTEFQLEDNGTLTISGMLMENSDRNSKHQIVPVNPTQVLAKLASLPIATWTYKADEPGVRHLGPMAQDFAAVFGLGKTETKISSLDMAGVSMAAIQALYQDNEDLRSQNDELQTRLDELSALVSTLMEKVHE